MFDIYLTNSLSRKKDLFQPIDANHIRLYACGPTVYDRAHLGNARAAVVYDMLFRLLKVRYGKVSYVRNITDVDDKIIKAASERGINIDVLTREFTDAYHQDMAAIGCLPPTHEPRATQYIQAMINMINKLIDKGHAYEAEGHVLFSVASYQNYGSLSRRSVEDMIAGARVEVAPYKKDPMDFVLWKPAQDHSSSFDSPFGMGRPGWHIECSAMSKELLGEEFDIHGGGADLMFPHHENEIAQSCASSGKSFAKYWVHNGFLTVDGEKMSKSLGNFKTVKDLLDEGISGPVIRYMYLTTHYRKPLDFNSKLIEDSSKALTKFSNLNFEAIPSDLSAPASIIADDLNTPALLAAMHEHYAQAKNGETESLRFICSALELLGINTVTEEIKVPHDVMHLAENRAKAKAEKLFDLADALRKEINNLGYDIKDGPTGYSISKRR